MPIDPGFAATLARELLPADFLRVLELFRIDLARLIAEVEAAANAGQHETLRRAAHGIVGAAGAVGATELEALARIAMRRVDAEMDPAAIARDLRRLADDALANIDHAIAQAKAT